jgi:Ca2+-transporting ATPase
MQKNWYTLSVQKTAELLEANLINGLDQTQVTERQKKRGKNKLPEKKPPSKFSIFFAQFKSPIIYVLVIAAAVTFFMEEFTDSLVIFLSVLVNALFGFWEENKSLSILEKLKKVLKTKATVVREGAKKVVDHDDLVPGDLLVLVSGDKVPADGRVCKSENLKVSEAVLTGEWEASSKVTKTFSVDTHLAERENMVYAGSLVEDGEGMAIITATGKHTEFGKTAELINQTKETPSPLQRKISKFGKTISYLILFMVGLIFVGGLLEKGDPLQMFEAAVAISVGGIPEALPVVMTIILAIGMDRLLKKKGLIRKLSSVETLGSTNVICFDKTKTLTQGKMQVSRIVSSNEKLALKIASLASEAYIQNPHEALSKQILQGSPTGKALVEEAARMGIIKNDLEKKEKEILRMPFASGLNYMLSLRKHGKTQHLYVLGAPESIIAASENKGSWDAKAQSLMQEGLRVVGVGFKEVNVDKPILNSLRKIRKFHFVGLIALSDPLRHGIQKAVDECESAGLTPIIITGDHFKTAKTVANEVGLKVKDKEIMQGRELDKLSDEQVEEIVGKIKLYARAEPKHKIRIIKAWQKRNAVVAMAGDGVNDAPAIKAADVGLALGSGTEVAIEAADLVLLNDSFQIIVDAIEQGRVVLDNLRKSISYILADSFTSVVLIGFSKVIFRWPIPILPVQILWNNLVEDTVPDIAYAFEPKEKEVMKRKPDHIHAPLLNEEMRIMIFGTGIIDEFLTLLLFWYLWLQLGLNLDYVRTMIFGAISIDTAFVIYAYKNLRKNIWKIDLFSNKMLNLSSLLVFATFSAAVYIPFFQKLLHTVPLEFKDWIILVGVGIVSLSVVEATKWFFIARHLTEED